MCVSVKISIFEIVAMLLYHNYCNSSYIIIRPENPMVQFAVIAICSDCFIWRQQL